jgi:hypothetical protein
MPGYAHTQIEMSLPGAAGRQSVVGPPTQTPAGRRHSSIVSKGKNVRRSLIDRSASIVDESSLNLQWSDMMLPAEKQDDTDDLEGISSTMFGFVSVLLLGVTLFVLVVIGHYFGIWSNIMYADGAHVPTWSDMFHSLLNSEEQQHELALQVANVVVVTVISIVFPITGILTQYASNQLTPDVTYFVSRDWRIIAISFFWLLQTLYVLTVSFVINEHFLPRGHFLLVLGTTLFALMLMPVFFVIIIGLLKPKRMLLRMLTLALEKSRKMNIEVELSTEEVEERKMEVCRLLEAVAAIGQGAIRRKNKALAYFAVEAIRRFCASYGKYKSAWEQAEGDEWFKVPDQENPDNFGLSSGILNSMKEKETWLEWKVLRQYQTLFADSIKALPELCYVIAVNTKNMAFAAALLKDYHTLDMTIKFFNTFLRLAINSHSLRTAYGIVNQYKTLNDAMLLWQGSVHITIGFDRTASGGYEKRASLMRADTMSKTLGGDSSPRQRTVINIDGATPSVKHAQTMDQTAWLQRLDIQQDNCARAVREIDLQYEKYQLDARVCQVCLNFVFRFCCLFFCLIALVSIFADCQVSVLLHYVGNESRHGISFIGRVAGLGCRNRTRAYGTTQLLARVDRCVLFAGRSDIQSIRRRFHTVQGLQESGSQVGMHVSLSQSRRVRQSSRTAHHSRRFGAD